MSYKIRAYHALRLEKRESGRGQMGSKGSDGGEGSDGDKNLLI